MPEDLSREAFAACLNESFRLESGSGPVELELIEASSLGVGHGARAEPFSLVFRGPKSALLAQGTYGLAHDRLGRLDLFLVPIGPDDTGMCFEAVFN